MTKLSNYLSNSVDDILELLNSDPDKVGELFIQFGARRIHIKQLGIERNTYLNWEKAGLIPYERKEGGWRRFSFVESVWIKTIQEMRSLGISIETIKEIKQRLWFEDMDVFYDQLIDSLKASTLELAAKDELVSNLDADGIASLKKGFEEMQVSRLMYTVIVSLIRKITYCLVINKKKEINLVPLVSFSEDMDKNIQEMQFELFSTSCTVINLWSIILELAMNENVKLSQAVLLQLLTPEEKRILDIIKQQDYSEMIINKKDGKPTHIRLKKTGIDEETIKTLKPYLKKGNYEHIEFKTRDGVLINFEETRTIKL